MSKTLLSALKACQLKKRKKKRKFSILGRQRYPEQLPVMSKRTWTGSCNEFLIKRDADVEERHWDEISKGDTDQVASPPQAPGKS